jgi:peptidoglycan hydrolase-like protein with peptidoglycan-binding domain
MVKKIGIAALIALTVIIFVTPVRKHVANLFHKNKSKMTETQVIGSVAGYNGRVKEIQKILEDMGLDPGAIDGRMGARTRLAIKEFQKRKGFAASGKIDSKTLSELNSEKEKIIESLLNPKVEADPLSSAELNVNSSDIQSESEKVIQKSEIQDNIMSYRLKSKDRTRQTQIALRKAGFYKGDIDGKLGPQTKKAIKAFQKSKGLTPDGVIGVRTWEELAKILKD